MKKLLLIPLTAICLNWSGAALAADFVAVRIEAENFTSKSDRWVLTSPNSSTDLGPDPDPPHNDTASGRANLELLPDTRVTHDDDVANGGMDGNFWGGPGGGPRIDYNIDMPEPGRYFVYVKTYSTGTEDNGIHVGINNTYPESGKRIQICSKHNWFWTSGQRTNENHCGVTKTIWLDVTAAGTNTISFFAREDGFEIDQIILLKETHDGSLDCFPNFGDKIRCRNISTGATYDTEIPFSQTVGGNIVTNNPAPQVTKVDLDIDVNAIGANHFINDTVEYQVKVSNKDAQDMATDTVAVVNLPAGLEYAGSSDCTESANKVTCDFNNMAAGSNETVSFFATVLTEGNHRVDAQVSADEQDDTSNNNTDSATITAAVNIPDYEAGVTLSQNNNVSAVGGSNEYTARITNNGLQAITNASLQVSASAGISLDPTQGCTNNCVVPAVAPGQSVDVRFHTISNASGLQNVSVQLILPNDANPSNDTASNTETVVSSAIATAENGEIAIEAESFSTASPAATDNAPKWYLVDANYNPLDASQDPDQASPVGVSGDAYMELLPDNRIDANGARTEGASNFTNGGVGATLAYNVLFSEAGTYYVQARIRANNTEDATLHIGLNNVWAETSTSLSLCNPNGTWQWTGSLKTDAGCYSTSAATINVETAGVQVLMVSQETDGLELDKIILSKTPIQTITDNGPSAKSLDPSANADIALSTSLSAQTAGIDEEVQLVVSLSNQSASQDSLGLTVTIDGLTQPIQSSAFDTCTTTATSTVCSLAKLNANSQVSETFSVSSSEAAELTISATVTSALNDSNAANNSDTETLSINSAITTGGGSLSMWYLLILLLPVSARAIQPITARATQSPKSKTHG